MRVKRFDAPNMPDALRQVRQDFGEQAVILQTSRLRRGLLGRLGLREQVQVLAALDDPAPFRPVPGSSPAPIVRPLAVASGSGHRASVATCPDTAPHASWRPDARRDGIARRLVESGMEPALADDILSACGSDLCDTDVAAAIERRLRVAPVTATKGCLRLALVGPTGVGKTTTTAKLAARYALAEKKRVALITIDTYRIGAVEQLRIYARVMGLPLEVVQSPEEMKHAVDRHADKDVVLIDTVGRSPRKALQLAEIKAFLNAAGPTETHLVLSAPFGLEYLLAAADQFAALDTDRLIVTKLDEMPRWGLLASLIHRTGLPLSFITDGQEVPRNLRAAHPGEIALQVLGGAG